MEILKCLNRFGGRLLRNDEDPYAVVQEGSQLGFAEFGIPASAVNGAQEFDFTDPRVREQLREGFLGKGIGITRRVFKGEVHAWVRPVVGGAVGIAMLAGLVVIEKKYRHGEDVRIIFERIGISEQDVIESANKRQRLKGRLKFLFTWFNN